MKTKPLFGAILGLVALMFVLFANLEKPGGRWNKHQWMSEMIQPPSAQEIEDYEKCQKSAAVSPMAYTDLVCVDPRQYWRYEPIRVELRYTGNQKDGKVHPACYTIDFCVKHSEVKVLPCEKF